MKALISVLLLAVTLSPCLLVAQEGMILVAGGTFQMGSTWSISNEMPVHAVTLSSFWLDAKEVTVAQYRAFCTATARSMPTNAPSWGWSDDNPMVFVSWNDATEYAQWAGKRLPTEAEWEYAARGGRLTHGYTYSGSYTLGDVAWYWANTGRTQAVGTKSPNELGLYDMSGNVFEMCSDWYDSSYYSVSPPVNPQGPSTGTERVMRGGDWNWFDIACRVAFRYGWPVWINGTNNCGFRCAMTEPTSVGSSLGDAVREFTLNQNYPNPFNPSTTIRYGLPSRSHVTLTVFNTLGQQVSVLQNGELEAGYHEVQFDAQNLPSGVYFYRMRAGSYVETKKFLLVR